jgi:hypothetical protein
MQPKQIVEKPKNPIEKDRVWKLAVVAAVPIGMVVAILVRVLWSEHVAQAPPQHSAQEIVTEDLNWANRQDASGIKAGLVPVHELFMQGRLGARSFVDDALGMYSKWKLITDFVTNSDEHNKYLEEQFGARVFSQEQLERAVESAVRTYMKRLDDIDSQLLIRLQADLASVPATQLSPGIDREAIRQVIKEALRQARTAATSELGGAVQREIISFVTAEVLTQAAAQLATSSGILGAGAASSVATFGTGLVVAFVADWAVSWAYDKLYDPVGELTGKLNGQLDQLEKVIVAGTARQPGLEKHLRDYYVRRSKARDAAIRKAILSPAPAMAL